MRAPERFDEEQIDVSAALFEAMGEIGRKIDARLVTRRQHRGDRRLPGQRRVGEGEADGAALRDHGDSPALGKVVRNRRIEPIHHRAERGRQPGAEVGEPLRVGTADYDVVPFGDVADPLLTGRSLAALFGESRREDHGSTDADLCGLFEYVADGSRGHQHQDQIDRVRQSVDRRVGLVPGDLVLRPADEVKGPGKSVVQHGPDDAAAYDVEVGCRADDRDAVRQQQLSQVRHRVSAVRGR